MLPSKKALIGGMVAAALFILVYNKVPAVRKALGGM
jgi:hypothetical protein